MKEYEKRGYLLENFRLFHLRSQGASKVDFHYHEFCKLLLLVSGQGNYYIDGQHYLLRPGDIVTVGSHSIHKPELEETSAYERIIIYIRPDWLQQMSTSDCDLLSLFSGRQGHVLRPREQKKKQLFQLAGALEREMAQEGFGRSLLCDACLIRLLVELGRSQAHNDETQPSPVMPQSQRNFQIMQYLDQHLAEDIDIDKLAEQFYVSKFYMMHSFRRETGATIHMYLTHKRLLLAQQLMAAGMSATESCYSSGFRSYSAFTRAYAKHLGTTPTGRTGNSLMQEEAFE